MRFAGFLGTLDEVEMIGPAIRHLRRIGVDLIVILDHGSTDGTLEAIAEEEAHGDVWLFHVEREEFPDPYFSDRAITIARGASVDWAFFMDTDEFWLPMSGSLHDLPELADNDILTVERFDAVLPREGLKWSPESLTPDHYDDVLVEVLSDEPDRWPKVLARPESITRIHPGDHDVDQVQGRTWRRRIADDVVIAHLPFSTFSRFERKVANIARAVEANPGFFEAGWATHWLAFHRLAQEGRLGQEFEAQLLDGARIADLRERGAVRSAAELLAGRRTRRTAPTA